MLIKTLTQGVMASLLVTAEPVAEPDPQLELAADHFQIIKVGEHSIPLGQLMLMIMGRSGPGMNEEQVISWYFQDQVTHGPVHNRAFAKAVLTKMKAEGVPPGMFETLVTQLAGGDDGEHGSDRSDLCPHGSCSMPLSMEQIWAYGCWCNLQNPVIGHGHPLDDYDAVCRNLIRCDKCAVQDGEDASVVCDPATSAYNTSQKTDPEDINLDCANVNDNDCATHVCSCTSAFLGQIMDLLWANVPRDTSLLHSDPTWDDSICMQSGDRPWEGFCCGLYPTRYHVYGPEKACCLGPDQAKPYRKIDQTCCPNGDIINSGDLC